MKDGIAADITRAQGRKSLFHFTRASALPAIARFDVLLSSAELSGQETKERRTAPAAVSYNGYTAILNSHLRIPDSMFAPGTTPTGFRAYLDKHVFFWPTVRYLRKMMETYSRREPEERFAVLEFAAYPLILDHFPDVKLSKYDSGSSPRFPASCTYRKSPDMFLPVSCFKKVLNDTVPVKPSQIMEVLVENRVQPVSRYLKAVWAETEEELPAAWRKWFRPLAALRSDDIAK